MKVPLNETICRLSKAEALEISNKPLPFDSTKISGVFISNKDVDVAEWFNTVKFLLTESIHWFEEAISFIS